MIKHCKICDKEFEGHISSLYCSPECKEKANTIRKEKINNEDKKYKPREFNDNLSKNNKSGYRGVYFDNTKNKWNVQLKFNKKSYKLGTFDDKVEAIIARQKAEIKFYGKILDEESSITDYKNEILQYINEFTDIQMLNICNSLYDYQNNEFVLLYKKFKNRLFYIDELEDLLIQESNNRFFKLKKINNRTLPNISDVKTKFKENNFLVCKNCGNNVDYFEIDEFCSEKCKIEYSYNQIYKPRKKAKQENKLDSFEDRVKNVIGSELNNWRIICQSDNSLKLICKCLLCGNVKELDSTLVLMNKIKECECKNDKNKKVKALIKNKKNIIKSKDINKYIGVYFDNNRQKWVAQIGHKAKKYKLGYFNDKDDAIELRRNAEQSIKDNNFDTFIDNLRNNKK